MYRPRPMSFERNRSGHIVVPRRLSGHQSTYRTPTLPRPQSQGVYWKTEPESYAHKLPSAGFEFRPPSLILASSQDYSLVSGSSPPPSMSARAQSERSSPFGSPSSSSLKRSADDDCSMTMAEVARRQKLFSRRDSGKLQKEKVYECDPTLVEVVPEERCQRCVSQHWRCFIEANPSTPRRVCRPCGKNRCSFGGSQARPAVVKDPSRKSPSRPQSAALATLPPLTSFYHDGNNPSAYTQRPLSPLFHAGACSRAEGDSSPWGLRAQEAHLERVASSDSSTLTPTEASSPASEHALIDWDNICRPRAYSDDFSGGTVEHGWRGGHDNALALRKDDFVWMNGTAKAVECAEDYPRSLPDSFRGRFARNMGLASASEVAAHAEHLADLAARDAQHKQKIADLQESYASDAAKFNARIQELEKLLAYQ